MAASSSEIQIFRKTFLDSFFYELDILIKTMLTELKMRLFLD
jgi:hypothetical protein